MVSAACLVLISTSLALTLDTSFDELEMEMSRETLAEVLAEVLVEDAVELSPMHRTTSGDKIGLAAL